MSEIKRLVALGELLAQQQARVKELEEELKAAKEAALRTEREDLPDLMIECGMQSFTLEDGSTVTIREEVDARITEATRAAALRWLTDNDYGGLIKTVVSLEFDRGERDSAVELASELGAALKETVHPATLKSFVRERMAEGAAIPADLFNIFPYNIAKLTKGKKK